MIRIVGVVDMKAGHEPFVGVPRDHMEMNMAILILKESKVQVIGLRYPLQRRRDATELVPQVGPFGSGEFVDGFNVAARVVQAEPSATIRLFRAAPFPIPPVPIHIAALDGPRR